MLHESKIESKNSLEDTLGRYNYRKTPERKAIYDACNEFGGMFTISDLTQALDNNMIHVSRATLYNTLNLFVTLRLIYKHTYEESTKYEMANVAKGHIRQICYSCGTTKKISALPISRMIMQAKMRRFKQENFDLTFYGLCASCQAKLKREIAKNSSYGKRKG